METEKQNAGGFMMGIKRHGVRLIGTGNSLFFFFINWLPYLIDLKSDPISCTNSPPKHDYTTPTSWLVTCQTGSLAE